MRILLLLAAVVLAFVALRWFSGAGEDSEPKEVQAATEAGVRFLSPPPVEAAAPEREPAPQMPSATSPQAEEPKAPSPTWPANVLASAGGGDDEIGLASVVVHGTPAHIQAAAKGLAPDRALLLESFGWAIAGERQVALSLSQKITGQGNLDEREKALFEAALTGKALTPASTGTTPVLRAMEMALLARDAKEALKTRQFQEAARLFSSLLLGELQAAWPADRVALAEWTKGLNEAQREHRWNPRSTWPSIEVKVGDGDSLIAIRKRCVAERPGMLMCTGLIERANRIKGYLQPGQTLKVPTDPARILVDLEACWALYFLGEEVAAAWPVGIGRAGEETPTGDYTVRNKLENPPWMKEGQEPIPFGDPRNPLGTRWLGWSREGAKTSYGFHGTWDPESIGKASSDGCIRLLNQDVEELFQILPEGAPIRIEG